MYNKKYISSEGKYISSDVKNTSVATDSLNPSKRTIQDRGAGLKKRTRKEIDKLEGKEWLRATMIELEGLPKEGTNRFLTMSDFMGCYNAWIALQDAYRVRDKIAWLIAKLKSDPETEE
ncbi:hypothetical protein ES705_43530 [subsurface metagenome]